MKNKLTDLHITEVSGVDKAANKRQFLIIKSAGGEGGENLNNGPGTEKDLTFFQKMADSIKSIFKGEGQSFAANVMNNQINEKYWLATDALRMAIRNTIEDEKMTEEEKGAKIASSLEEFKVFMLGILNMKSAAESISKAGAKISAARMDKLKACQDLLGEILAEAQGTGEIQKGEGGEDMDYERIKKMFDDAVEPLSKAAEDIKKTGEAVEEVKTSMADLAKRVEALETKKGIRKSAAAADEEEEEEDDKEVKKSFWGGIL